MADFHLPRREFLKLLTLFFPATLTVGADRNTERLIGRTARETEDSLTSLAERYLVLVLSVGRHDPLYVDSYYGPPKLKAEAERRTMGLAEIHGEAQEILKQLRAIGPAVGDEMLTLRHRYLARQTASLVSRVEILQGRRLTFDEESEALYDARAPIYGAAHFQNILDNIGQFLPGSGSIPERYNTFRKQFVVPMERLDSLIQAAVKESRRRTLTHIPLPAEENFRIEYVKGKSWGAYNWYQGGCHSLIQINTDFPIFIDQVINWSSHEGYPGHHVYSTLLETELVRKRGWPEYTVLALFSPQSLMAEGTANFGVEVAFNPKERVAFERETLYPLAGLDPDRAEQYYRVLTLTQRLSYARNEAARRYLNGEITREEAARWLVMYALIPPEQAMQQTKFFDQYRSYVINYNLGQDMVKSYIDARAGSPPDPEKRWKEFAELLASPRLPSELK